MVGETAGKVAHATAAVARNVWHLSNMIKHLATGEEEDSDQADSGPNVAVLDDGQQVWPGNADKRDRACDSGSNGYAAEPVHRPVNRGVRTIREMANKPGVDLFG